MSGAKPRFRPQTDPAAELTEIAGQVAAWTEEHAVHVGTMHRLKGLEYRFMMISGIGTEHFPFGSVRKLEETDPQRYELELEKARNPLFVAATRARDEVVLTWSGAPTKLLRLQV
jgi:superfamily I DNA/RNA helicase